MRTRVLHPARTSHCAHTTTTLLLPWPEDGDAWSCAPCIAAGNIPYHHLVSLINMRTNSHNLNIERMRHLRPRVPRAQRLCPWCRSPEAVHDELHCVLECPHVSPVRLQFPALFAAGGPADMRTLFTDGSYSCALASFVYRLLRLCDEDRARVDN